MDWISSTQRHLQLTHFFWNCYQCKVDSGPKHIWLSTAVGTTVLPNTYHLPTALSQKSEPRNLPTQMVTNSIWQTSAGHLHKGLREEGQIWTVPTLRELRAQWLGQGCEQGQGWSWSRGRAWGEDWLRNQMSLHSSMQLLFQALPTPCNSRETKPSRPSSKSPGQYTPYSSPLSGSQMRDGKMKNGNASLSHDCPLCPLP